MSYRSPAGYRTAFNLIVSKDSEITNLNVVNATATEISSTDIYADSIDCITGYTNILYVNDVSAKNISGDNIISQNITTTNLIVNDTISGPLIRATRGEIRDISSTTISGVSFIGTGNSLIRGDLSVNGIGRFNSLFVETDLVVAGDTIVRDDVMIVDDTSISGTLTVIEGTILRDTLSVSGASHFGSSLSVSGGTILRDTLSVSGAITTSRLNTTDISAKNIIIDTSLGIGISNPFHALDVNGAIRLYGKMNDSVPGSNQVFLPRKEYIQFAYTDVSAGTGSDYARIYCDDTGTTGPNNGVLVLEIADDPSTAADKFIIRASNKVNPPALPWNIIDIATFTSAPTQEARVGIGITSPTTSLDICGHTKIRGVPGTTLPTLSLASANNVRNSIIRANLDDSINYGLQFLPNGDVVTMVCTSNGNVGIGTNSPSHPLDVSGSVRFLNSSYNPLKISGRTDDGGNNLIYLANNRYESGTNLNNRWGIGLDNSTHDNNVSSLSGSDLYIAAYGNGSYLSTPIFIKRVNGNVGIQTNNPSYTLDVNGPSRLNTSSNIGITTNISGVIIGNTTTTPVDDNALVSIRFGNNKAQDWYLSEKTNMSDALNGFVGNVGFNTSLLGKSFTIKKNNADLRLYSTGSNAYGFGICSGSLYTDIIGYYYPGMTNDIDISYVDTIFARLNFLDGRLGIGRGLLLPSYTLDVSGTFRISNNDNSIFTETDAGNALNIQDTGNNILMRFAQASNSNFIQSSLSNSSTTFAPLNISKVGSSTPYYKFYDGGMDISGIVKIGTFTNKGSSVVIGHNNTSNLGSHTGGLGLILQTDDTQKGYVRTRGNQGLYLGANDINHVFIGTTGNIGIGTDTPSNTLDISGIFGVRANKPTIQTNSTGYVGIGITNPTTFLDVCGNIKIRGLPGTSLPTLTFSSASNNSISGAIRSNLDNNINYGLQFLPNGDVVTMVCTSNGNVGIQTNNPLFPLDVGFSTNQSFSTNAYFDTSSASGSAPITTSLGTKGVSIKGLQYMWATGGFVASSDRRIKTDISDLLDNECLSIIRKLKPKKYSYIDKLERGPLSVYGFIAQDIANDISYATSIQTELIPDYYSIVSPFSADSSSIEVILDKDYSISNGTDIKVVVSYLSKDGSNNELFFNSTCLDYNSSSKHLSFNHSLPISSIDDVSAVFLYGKKVDDFHTLNKDAIWTIATAALQEIDRIQIEHQNEINKLKQQPTTYRGSITLSSTDSIPTTSINLDTYFSLSSGDFSKKLNPQIFLQNRTGWTQVRGSIIGDDLVIESNPVESTDIIDFMILVN